MGIAPRLLLVVLAGAIGAGLVGCGGGDDSASDRPVTALAGDGFKVRMPGSPKRQVLTARTSAGPVPVTAFISEDGTEGFSMSVLTIPKGVKGDLEGAVKGAAASVKGTLTQSTSTRYQGFPARDARITNAADEHGNKGTVFARVIRAGRRIFQLQFVTDGANVKQAPPAYETFVGSLKID